MEPRVVRLMAGKKRAAKQFEGDMVREAFVQEAGDEEAAYTAAINMFNMMDDGQTQRLLDEANAETKRPTIKRFDPAEFATPSEAVAPVTPEPSDGYVDVEDVDILAIWDTFDSHEQMSSTEFMKRQLGS